MMKRIEICPVVSDKKIFKVFYIDISRNPKTSLTNIMASIPGHRLTFYLNNYGRGLSKEHL